METRPPVSSIVRFLRGWESVQPDLVSNVEQKYGAAAAAHLLNAMSSPERKTEEVIDCLASVGLDAMEELFMYAHDMEYDFDKRFEEALKRLAPQSIPWLISKILTPQRIQCSQAYVLVTAQEATRLLAYAGPDSIEHLVSIWDSIPQINVHSVVQSLGAFGESARPLLAKLATHYDSEVRRIALDRLAEMLPSTLELIVRGTQDTNADIRCTAVRNLGPAWADEPASQSAVLGLLDDREARARCAALDALHSASDEVVESISPQLLRLLQDGDEATRRHVVPLLPRCKLPAETIARTLIVAAGESHDESFQEVCISYLAELPGRSLDELLNARQHADSRVRRFAVQQIAAIAPERLLEDDTEIEKENQSTAEDAQILAWFDSVQNLKEYMEELLVFWCMGQVDREAIQSQDRAIGYQRLEEMLDESLRANPLKLPHGQSYLRDTCIVHIVTFFDREPFRSAAFGTEVEKVELRVAAGGRGHRWTDRAARAWHLVDRFLTLRGLRPTLGPSQTLEESD